MDTLFGEKGVRIIHRGDTDLLPELLGISLAGGGFFDICDGPVVKTSWKGGGGTHLRSS